MGSQDLALDAEKLKRRAAHLRAAYGISLEEWDEMWAAQGGRCAVCHKVPRTRPVVDHDHRTGLVRGLLCNYCNHQVIGRHRDPELFTRAAEYLRRPPALTVVGERSGHGNKKRRRPRS